jgi:protein-S-isoprenylcysteine O-methyltransferase Ste14
VVARSDQSASQGAPNIGEVMQASATETNMGLSEPAQAERRWTEAVLRAFALLAYGFAVRNLAMAWWADRTRLTLLLLLLTEGFTLILVLFARRAQQRDLKPLSLALNIYAAFSYVLFDPRATTSLIPELAGASLQICGAVWQFAAKVTLGRSFGVLPAHRGLVLRGPYRIVRHPIYLGYLIGHIAFLLVNFSWRNLIVLGVLYAVQWLRIRREEEILSKHCADYRPYQQRVRWRILPFIY